MRMTDLEAEYGDEVSRGSRIDDLIHEKSQFMDQLFKSWKSCINGIVVDGAANGLKDCDAEA